MSLSTEIKYQEKIMEELGKPLSKKQLEHLHSLKTSLEIERYLHDIKAA